MVKFKANKLTIMISMLLMLLIVSTSLAQTTNDPHTNDGANACLEGGTLEGYCNITDADSDGVVDEFDVKWMWACGWYLIRADYAMIAREDIPLDGCELPERIIPMKKEKKQEPVKKVVFS